MHDVPPPPMIRQWRDKPPKPGTCHGCASRAPRGWANHEKTLCVVCQPWSAERIIDALRAVSAVRVPTLLLIGCGRAKRQAASPAYDLYKGPLYRSTLAYARALGLPWVILSAKWGVVEGHRVLKPYDIQVEALKGLERRAWARKVVLGLKGLLPETGPRRVVVLAGANYTTPWLSSAEDVGWEVVQPLARLNRTNLRMKWLDKRPLNLPIPLGEKEKVSREDDRAV